MKSYDSRQLEQLEPFLAFVEALTKPEALRATVENLRTENTKYQELLGAFNTKKLAETEAHRILDEAEKKAEKVNKDLEDKSQDIDFRLSKVVEKEKLLSELKANLEGLEMALKKQAEDVQRRETLALEKEVKNQTYQAKLAEWEDSLRKQATELTEKAEKIKALVG